MSNLISQFDVTSKGFDINIERGTPEVYLHISELPGNTGKDLFGADGERNEEDKMVFELRFKYGEYDFPVQTPNGELLGNTIRLEEKDGVYTFFKLFSTKRKN
jgi:hypothetical protein